MDLPQAELGTSHDAFVDFAGLLCDTASMEAWGRAWVGLEGEKLSQPHLLWGILLL